MSITECVLKIPAELERHVKLLTAATRADEIIGAVSGYLVSWSKDRIEDLQKIDGGWGTFDSQKRPKAIRGIANILVSSDVLSAHCRALRNAGMEPTPELLELDLYFALAKEAAENFIASRSRSPSVAIRTPGYRHWSDKDAKAA